MGKRVADWMAARGWLTLMVEALAFLSFSANLSERRQIPSMLFEGKERREKERAMKAAGRLPPGQSLTLKWPVLHYGSVPKFDPESWDFRVYGLVENPVRWDWNEFSKLPRV